MFTIVDNFRLTEVPNWGRIPLSDVNHGWRAEGKNVGLELKTTQREIEALLDNNAELRKSPKVTFSDSDWTPPLYNVWAFGKNAYLMSPIGNTRKGKIGSDEFIEPDPAWRLRTSRPC